MFTLLCTTYQGPNFINITFSWRHHCQQFGMVYELFLMDICQHQMLPFALCFCCNDIGCTINFFAVIMIIHSTRDMRFVVQFTNRSHVGIRALRF